MEEKGHLPSGYEKLWRTEAEKANAQIAKLRDTLQYLKVVVDNFNTRQVRDHEWAVNELQTAVPGKIRRALDVHTDVPSRL